MKSKKWTRRQVIGSLAVLPLAAGTKLVTTANFLEVKLNDVRCKLLNSDGELYDVGKMGRFYICDLLSRPFAIDPQFTPGEIKFVPAEQPFRISLPVVVPGFGEVFCYADNRGTGYTAKSLAKTDSLFLNYEFAADRLATVHKLADECRKLNINLPAETMARITSAERFFAQCGENKANDKAVAKLSMESLRESLWAGENIVLERARYQIEKRGVRNGFLFGCNGFRFRDYGNPYTKLFEGIFNYATIPFYMGSAEKVYSRIDTLITGLQNTQIIPKGHPLIFLTPSSLKSNNLSGKPFEDVKKVCIKYINDTIQKFRGRIHIWDVVNEAHVQPDIQYGEGAIPGYTKEKAIELTCDATIMAHLADPTCYRVVNSTGTWSDYYMGREHPVWQQTAYDYLTMLEDAKCSFEAIGLQYYHSGRDLLEFERDLERFSHFNKPIHITELQIPSSSGAVDRGDWWGGGVGGARFPWHGPEFTNTIQADWVEGIYTLLYSKPYVDAATWWDMTDPGFVPHGGLVNADMSPKESYFRLKSLVERWKNS